MSKHNIGQSGYCLILAIRVVQTYICKYVSLLYLYIGVLCEGLFINVIKFELIYNHKFCFKKVTDFGI